MSILLCPYIYSKEEVIEIMNNYLIKKKDGWK
jgi:hypothetical protein